MFRHVRSFRHDTRRICHSGNLKWRAAIKLIVIINLLYSLQWFLAESVLRRTDANAIVSKPQVEALIHNPSSQFQHTNTMNSTPPQSLTDYIKWHSNMRSCMSSTSCVTKIPKIILWKCPDDTSYRCAGVGDRFRALHFSLLLAIVTKRMLFIDWPDQPFPFDLVVVPAAINWNLPFKIETKTWPSFSHEQWPFLELNRHMENNLSDSEAEQTLPKLYEKIALDTPIDLSKKCVQQELKNVPDFVLYSRATPASTVKLSRNNRSMKEFKDLKRVGALYLQRLLLNALFSPSLFVKSELHNRLGLLRQKEYISIHVRTGLDIGENAHPRFRNLPQKNECVAKLVISIISKTHKASRRHPIFIASDSTPLKKVMRTECEKRSIPVFYSSSRAFHVGRKWGYRRNLNDTGMWVAFLNVFVDFFAIAGGTEIFGNGSGFSYLAYVYGNATRYSTMTMEVKC